MKTTNLKKHSFLKNGALIALFLLVLAIPLQAQNYDEELKRERLSDLINTEYTETKPIISYDNSTLFLTRQNHPENFGGENDEQDIFFSKRDFNDQWMRPENIGAPLNTGFPNGISSLSIGADTALVINVYKGKKYDIGASLSIKKEGTWSAPKAINVKKFQNFSGYVDYFVAATGEHLFLAIENRDSYGDQDIYISRKIDEYNWTEPVNLGPGVNTEGGEFSPFLSSDNKILFFSSYGHEGYGDADIFYSIRQDDSWTNWSEAKNLGELFNTEGFEGYFTIPAKGDYAYFVSDHETNAESKDIFRGLIPLELNPTPGVIVSGITKNEISGEAISATVNIMSTEPGVEDKTFVTQADDFIYRRSILEFPRTFQLLAEEKGYMTTSQYLTVEHDDKREVKVDLYLVPIELGNTLISHNVGFNGRTSYMDKTGVAELTRILGYLKSYPEINMRVNTHVQNSGKGESDQLLTEQRSEAIKSFFLKNGVDPKRLTFLASGSTTPFVNTNKLLVRQPEVPDERVSFTIYADQDGDSVEDDKDKCIDVPGIPENQGCPEIAQEVKEVFAQALSGIQFETAKDIIKPVSFPILDNVVDVMNNNQSYFLKISGHTDSQGNDESNQDLSERRAASTLKYLVDKGISTERLKAYGFGETQPVADNETAEGRAKNRRVVFEVVFDAADL